MNKFRGYLTNAALLSTEFCLTSTCKHGSPRNRNKAVCFVLQGRWERPSSAVPCHR